MANTIVPSFALVDKTQPQRILALLDEAFAAWAQQTLPVFGLIPNPVLNYGTIVDTTVGRFEYLYDKTNKLVLLTVKPDNMSLGDAYQYVIKQLFA